MPHTLLLNDKWDLCLNAAGEIATDRDSDAARANTLHAESYAIAQNVANAVRLFTDDAYFFPERGIPHLQIELGRRPALAVFRSRVRETAQSVEGVASAFVASLDIEARTLTGDIQITTDTGDNVDVAI